MKDFTVEYSKFGFYNEGNKKEIAEDNFSDKSFDEETIPDEEFNKTKKKTELCKNYELYHDCYYKEECCFAHGVDELRENINSSSYKTKMCKSFQNNFVCNFGIRCSYRHNIK